MEACDCDVLTDIGLGIVLDGYRVLIARRHDDVDLPGLWEFPGGKVGPEESVTECVEREVEEEVDLHVRAESPFAVLEHRYAHANVRLHCCLCTVVSGKPRAVDCAEVKWVPSTELSRYQFPEANAPLLDRLARRVGL